MNNSLTKTARSANTMGRFAITSIAVVALNVSVLSPIFAADTETTPAQNEKFLDFVKGKEAVQAKDWRKAADHFAAAAKQDPRNADAHNMYGFALRWLNRFDESFAAYDRALVIDPKHKGALHYSGLGYIRTNQRDKAQANLVKLQAICADCDETKTLARALKDTEATKDQKGIPENIDWQY